MRWQLADQAIPHLHADKPGGTTGEQDRPHNPGFQWGNKTSKPLTEKPVGGEAAGETPSLTGELVGETHRVLEHTQTHLPGNQHQKGPICLWVVGEVTESRQRAEQAALFSLGPLPYMQHNNTATWASPPW